jgi:hypothetical protein
MEIQRPPRRQLVRVADVLEEAIGSFVQTRGTIQPDTTWEAPLEAWAISNLMVRNIEGVVVLARHDEVLAPAAWANARNVFDAAARILWLISPDDRFEAEARWITLLAEYERFHRRMAEYSEISASAATIHRAQAEQILGFRQGVLAAISEGYGEPRRLPKTDKLLKELGVAGMYELYVEGSQYMHATMPATALYRKNLGNKKEFGDFVSISHWIVPLRTCWICLHNAGRFVVSRLRGTDRWDILGSELNTRLDDAFHALAREVPDNAAAQRPT